MVTLSVIKTASIFIDQIEYNNSASNLLIGKRSIWEIDLRPVFSGRFFYTENKCGRGFAFVKSHLLCRQWKSFCFKPCALYKKDPL